MTSSSRWDHPGGCGRPRGPLHDAAGAAAGYSPQLLAAGPELGRASPNHVPSTNALRLRRSACFTRASQEGDQGRPHPRARRSRRGRGGRGGSKGRERPGCMKRVYPTPVAFEQALQQRLRTATANGGQRQLVVFDAFSPASSERWRMSLSSRAAWRSRSASIAPAPRTTSTCASSAQILAVAHAGQYPSCACLDGYCCI